MATMNSEVYDALVAAGAPEEKARKAAEAIAAGDRTVADVKNDLTLVKFMVATNIALTIGVLMKLFTP